MCFSQKKKFQTHTLPFNEKQRKKMNFYPHNSNAATYVFNTIFGIFAPFDVTIMSIRNDTYSLRIENIQIFSVYYLVW